MIAILIRAVRAQDEQARDKQAIEEANARIAANTAARAKGIEALTLFGFEAIPNQNIWDQVRRSLGDEAYDRAVFIARGLEPPALLAEMGDERASSQPEVEEAGTTTTDAPSVRDAILEYLQTRGSEGAQVGEIKRYLANAYGLHVHQKTPGMTLYRLLKEGLAARQGRTWRIKETAGNKENEAPSGDAAGASDAGEGATSPNESPSTLDEVMS